METYQRRDIVRLRAILDKPIADPSDSAQADVHFDPWRDLFDVVSAYDSELDEMAIAVLKAVALNDGNHAVIEKYGVGATLFMHMLCTWLCDYGMYPMACFPEAHLRHMWDELIGKWEAYAQVEWKAREG